MEVHHLSQHLNIVQKEDEYKITSKVRTMDSFYVLEACTLYAAVGLYGWGLGWGGGGTGMHVMLLFSSEMTPLSALPLTKVGCEYMKIVGTHS